MYDCLAVCTSVSSVCEYEYGGVYTYIYCSRQSIRIEKCISIHFNTIRCCTFFLLSLSSSTLLLFVVAVVAVYIHSSFLMLTMRIRYFFLSSFFATYFIFLFLFFSCPEFTKIVEKKFKTKTIIIKCFCCCFNLSVCMSFCLSFRLLLSVWL